MERFEVIKRVWPHHLTNFPKGGDLPREAEQDYLCSPMRLLDMLNIPVKESCTLQVQQLSFLYLYVGEYMCSFKL